MLIITNSPKHLYIASHQIAIKQSKGRTRCLKAKKRHKYINTVSCFRHYQINAGLIDIWTPYENNIYKYNLKMIPMTLVPEIENHKTEGDQHTP
jgi:hypothetical protein